ncbi:glycosyltransferase [Acidocella sp.]|uniref:glycosyltransferase n=1 Tax=Acidocella sp. TaxID=50710 RepID=UPI0026300428|nr:glycosyltransferase [Acidocella sp.]
MIYYSHRTRKALAEGHVYLPLGFAHYSYGSVCQKFQKLFEASELAAEELMMPEIYASYADLGARGAARPLHVAFKPYEEIRLLKGAANVAHVAWEFDRLPTLGELAQDHPRRANPMNDYVRMLRLADEVWVGCTYTKQVFEGHGLGHVEVLPAPIETGRAPPRRRLAAGRVARMAGFELTRQAVAALVESTGAPRLEQATLLRAHETRAAGGRVFVSVFNPSDPRKNIGALLLGFQSFLRRQRRADLLIIKLVLADTQDALRLALREQMPRAFERIGVPFSFMDCANILVVPEHLTPDALSNLYRAADFYVCTSAAEGQGLPMQEAMAAGLVPISPAITAMADYILPGHAVVMAATRAPIPLQTAEAYGLGGLSWNMVDHREVSAALAAAAAMAPDEHERRARAAWQFIRDHYGFDVLRETLLARRKALLA